MWTLALCDDDPQQRAQVADLLRPYLQAHPDLHLSCFSSAQELLDKGSEGFDLYLLDIVMPEMSGIDLGIKLREQGCQGSIIYLSVTPEFAVDSYEARAFYYLLKPIDPQTLYQVLDQALAALEQQKAASLPIKTKEGPRLIQLDQILYAELLNRAAHYHLSSGETVSSITLRQSFQNEMEPLLAHPRFIACGASFVVNLYYIVRVEKNLLRLDDGTQLSIPRGSAPRLRQIWNDYWLEMPRGKLL